MNDRAAVRSGGLAITNPKIMLFALLLVYILNFLDRQIVNILAEPIKGELGLSDTQLGLLAGPAFAVFYAVLGIPIARYADNAKTNRVWLISICLAVWSGMTAICGFAQNFAQLALARIGVGVGEAGCTPAAHSLIADSVPPEKRSSAIAFFWVGHPNWWTAWPHHWRDRQRPIWLAHCAHAGWYAGYIAGVSTAIDHPRSTAMRR